MNDETCQPGYAYIGVSEESTAQAAWDQVSLVNSKWGFTYKQKRHELLRNGH